MSRAAMAADTTPAAVPRADFMPLGDLARIQRERWAAQAAYVGERSAFYAKRFARHRLRGDLDALEELPFTDKAMLRADQSAKRRESGDEQSGDWLVQSQAKITICGSSMHQKVAVDCDQAKVAMFGDRLDGPFMIDLHGIWFTGGG